MWNWRRAGFFALDKLRGGPYRRHLADLAAWVDEPALYTPVIETRIQRFLEHATSTTEAYAPYRGSVNLRDFPVLDKRDALARPGDFTSTALDTNRLPRMRTSGSYGTPFSFPVSHEKRVRQRAEIIHFNRWASLDVGDRHAFSGATARNKPVLTRFLQNQTWLDPTFLTDEWMSRHCDQLRRRRLTALVSQPSFSVFLARRSMVMGLTPSDYALRGIVVTAETLHEPARRDIEQAFGCPVLGRYATRELSVLAMECPEERAYHVNPTSVVMEILALDSDDSVSPGEVGRVVATDLFSHAMPLIRYDTGDLALQADSCRCGRPGQVLASIMGRAVELLYTPDGTPVYPVAVNTVMSAFDNVVQYQFRQCGEREYVVLLRTLPEFSQDRPVIRSLRQIFGEDASIRLEHVEDIPPLPSGKRAYAVNEWKPGTGAIETTGMIGNDRD